jgi:Porin subfamily
MRKVRRAPEVPTMLKLSTPLPTLVLLAMLVPGPSALAQSADTKGVNMRALGERNAPPVAKPGKGTGDMKPCPEYGAGFYRLGGSDTCARIGGAVGSEVGTTVRR